MGKKQAYDADSIAILEGLEDVYKRQFLEMAVQQSGRIQKLMR